VETRILSGKKKSTRRRKDGRKSGEEDGREKRKFITEIHLRAGEKKI